VLDGIAQLVPPSVERTSAAARGRRTLGEKHLAMARAELALAAGSFDDVLELVSEADAKDTPCASYLRAQAFVALERWDDASSSLAVARDDAVAQNGRSLLWRIDALAGTVQLGKRRRIEARRSFDAARSLVAELVVGVEDHELITAFHAAVDRMAPPPAIRTVAQEEKAAHGGLTRRERETAALLALGRSNRAIARSLGIGERTVEGHVASALSKLGFSSRAQLAVWATEQGIANSPYTK
jgi:DNA-binding CsgD family transcriptional regulator